MTSDKLINDLNDNTTNNNLVNPLKYKSDCTLLYKPSLEPIHPNLKKSDVSVNSPSVNHSTTVQEYKDLTAGGIDTDGSEFIDYKTRNNSNQLPEISDKELFIKQEVKKAFEIEKKANNLFKKNQFDSALKEYLKVNRD